VSRFKNLIIETFPLFPHLETAGEIAISLKKKGETVYFFWCGDNLPFADWHLPFYKRFLGLGFNQKIKKFIRILKNNNIEIIDDVQLSVNLIKKINFWASKFHGNLNDLKNYKYHNAILGNSVASSLISLRHEKNFIPEKNINLVKKCLISSATVYEKSKIVIKKIKPNSLYTFNNRFLISRPIIEAGKLLKVEKILRHERGANKFKYEIFEKDIHDYDYRYKLMMNYWKQGPKTKHLIANNFFKKQKKIFNNHFFKNKNKNKKEQREIEAIFKKKDKKIIFFASTDYEYEAWTSYVNKKKYYFKNQLHALIILKKIVKKLNKHILIIRCHPSKKLNKFEKKDEENILRMKDGKKIFVIKSSEPINSYELIDKSDIVTTFGSTIGIEAFYWRKPSISLRENTYNKLNILNYPKNEYQLKLMLLQKKTKLKNKTLCFPAGYFSEKFGRSFKYFNSLGNGEGKLMGTKLTHRSKVANLFINLKKYL
tara:strand:- start:92 stop:1543 length:1452 start_codon:yes stop_codon:yes gene_type:complete